MFKGIEFFKGKSRGAEYGLLPSARNDACSAGRSMIEMLGVLAIVCVLTVGGIAGYSKAMEKFKVNKTIDEVLTIVSNIRILYANATEQDMWDDWYNFDNPHDFYAFVRDYIFPKETDTDGNRFFVHALGGRLYVEKMSDYKGILIGLNGLSREACITLATNDWGGDSSGFVGIEAGIRIHGIMIECNERIEESVRDYADDDGVAVVCRPLNVNTLPLPPALAAKGCDCIDKSCNIELLFEE